MSDKFFIRDDQYNVKSMLFDSYDEALREVAQIKANTPSGVACICRESDYWFAALAPNGKYAKESSLFGPVAEFIQESFIKHDFKAIPRERPVGDGVKDDRAAIQYPVKEAKPDPINHPAHYNQGKIEAIDVIEDWRLGFCLGNCVKYIARAPHKWSTLEDLRKARWYLDREIWKLEQS